MAKMRVVKRVAVNVRSLRLSKFNSVENACSKTGISVPRWYRLEQGNNPGMLGAILDEVSHALGVDAADLVTSPDTKRLKQYKFSSRSQLAKDIEDGDG